MRMGAKGKPFYRLVVKEKRSKRDGKYIENVGTYNPMLDPAATKYDEISYLKVLGERLKVMDATAISLCMDNKLPIIVFNLRTGGNLRRVVMGEPVGTTVRA